MAKRPKSQRVARKEYTSPGRSILALYGNVGMQRAWCDECETTALVLDGLLQCCDRSCTEHPVRTIREVEPEFIRRRPTARERREILSDQEHRCLYCGVTFDSRIYHNGKSLRARLEWDHAVPFSFSQNNDGANFVAACHVCNRLKKNYLFRDCEEARIFIQELRERRGYSFVRDPVKIPSG